MLSHHTTAPKFIALGPKALDLAGQRFGRLVALGPIGRNKHGNVLWLCQCDCGKNSEVLGGNLRTGNTKSCGCWQQQKKVCVATHEMSATSLYSIWTHIIQRCTNPAATGFADYGGRGINICPLWRHSFDAFRDHVSALGNYGTPGFTLDRIDNDGDYEPSNVRWVTRYDQNRNKRNNRWLTYKGESQLITDWAARFGISRGTIISRLRRGWSAERALETPVAGGKRE